MAHPYQNSFQGSSLSQRLVGVSLLIVALAMAVLLAALHQMFTRSLQKQVNALGDTLIIQTARDVAVPLRAQDSLGLTVVLRDLADNPYIAHAVLYGTDNRVLAEAGKRPRRVSVNSLFNRPIAFDQVLAGELQISVDAERLQAPLKKILQNLALVGIACLLVMLFLLSHLARSISQPLQQLYSWLLQPVGHAPGQQRNDEVGHLARAMDQLFAAPEEPAPVHELNPAQLDDDYDPDETDTDEQLTAIYADPDTPYPDSTQLQPGEPVFNFSEILADVDDCAPAVCQQPENAVVLAVELQIPQSSYQMTDERKNLLHQNYQAALEHVADNYQGELLHLAGGQALILFYGSREDYIENALGGAELLRAFVHELQMEVADTGTILSMQLGLSHDESMFDNAPEDLQDTASVRAAVELSRQSRNLVLLDDYLATLEQTGLCASIRALPRLSGASCIERLISPYAEALEHNLAALLEQLELQ